MNLRTGIVLSFAAVLVATFVSLGWIFHNGLNRYGDSTALAAVQTRSHALTSFISRSLQEQWRAVEQQARRLSPSVETGAMQVAVDGLAAGSPQSSWVGIARADGTVIAASSGLLIGQNVASRPWFAEGLKGPFAGDVHEAVLLARLLENDDGEPLRFIDFSAPILSPDGSVWGVLGAHLNWRWVRDLVGEAADQLALEAFLVNAAGTVILSTGSFEEAMNGLAVFRAAGLGQGTSTAEVWPDGRTYYAVTLVEPRSESLPPFGWRYVVRLDPSFVFGAGNRFGSEMMTFSALALVGALLLLTLLAGFFTRPLRSLLEALAGLSRGEKVDYQRARTRYRELSMLSQAIARLQSKPLTDRPRNDPPQ